MTVWVGTSGWQYKDWRGRFYPAKLPQRQWLEHYAERFATVEVNNAFYRLPERSVFESWKERTPADFVVGVKASRYLSHIRRLRDPSEPVGRLMERAAGLGSKLGPVLLQLPPDFKRDLGRLEETLACFPGGVRVAVELRHPSWFADETWDVLRRHDAAFCFADSPALKTPRERTASFGYVRFHSGRAFPPPCYGRTALRRWAEDLAGRFAPSEDLYAYFNNDPGGCAVRDAARFAGALERAGLSPTRVPAVREAPVGPLSLRPR
jgi:uncharacterized protein YecE (DUF72 family)